MFLVISVYRLRRYIPWVKRILLLLAVGFIAGIVVNLINLK